VKAGRWFAAFVLSGIPANRNGRAHAGGSIDASAGGLNVIAAPPGFSGSLINVSLEDVLASKPDVIIASDPAFASIVRSLRGWLEAVAVRNGRIFVPPDLPFGWFDAPPSLNRLLGIQWLARILHPKLFPEPLGPLIKAFHRLYYHREPTDSQVRALLEIAGISQ
jgi:iron complex transport system substrate-binding protein